MKQKIWKYEFLANHDDRNLNAFTNQMTPDKDIMENVEMSKRKTGYAYVTNSLGCVCTPAVRQIWRKLKDNYYANGRSDEESMTKDANFSRINDKTSLGRLTNESTDVAVSKTTENTSLAS